MANINPYTSAGFLKFWSQKVLPTSFDEALSYFETLSKVVDKLNDVIGSVDTCGENVEILNTAFEDLKAYVEEHVDDTDTVVENLQNMEVYAESLPSTADVTVSISGGQGKDDPFVINFGIPAGKVDTVDEVTYQYAKSEDRVQPTVWQDTIPTVESGWYLWTKVTLNFESGTVTEFCIVNRTGIDGEGSVMDVNGDPGPHVVIDTENIEYEQGVTLKEAIDARLEMDTTESLVPKIYGKDEDGEQIMFEVGDNAGDVVVRDENGNLGGDTPVTDNDYMPYGLSNNEPEEGGIPRYDENGNIKSGEPVDDDDCVRKVDLAGKADKPYVGSYQFTKTGWVQTDTNYEYTFTISGYDVTPNTMVNFCPKTGVITKLFDDVVIGLYCYNNNGVLKAIAVGNKPSSNLTVDFECYEVQSL